MNDLVWNDLENFREYGISSITVERSDYNSLTAIDSDDFGALRVGDEPKYNIELNVDSAGLRRLQDALKKEPRKPEDELKHELNVMHKVNEFEGTSISEKIDKYFDNVDSKAKVCEVKNNVAIMSGRYKIKHR